MERLTHKIVYDNKHCHYVFSYYQDSEVGTKLGKLEDVLEKYDIKSAEDLDKFIHHKNCQIEKWKQDYENCSKLEKSMSKEHQYCLDNWRACERELTELKQKAIVFPFEFDKPFYKLCPKCNDKQTDCKHCAWGGCGFNQCYDICHKENKGQIICEITFKKDNCNVSWNAIRFISEHWGEYYFATKEEAEQKLAKIGEKDE